MSVEWIREIWDGREGTFDEDDGARRQWRAMTNNKYDDAFTIEAYGRANNLLPIRFEPHPSRPGLTRRRMTVTNESDNPFVWTIEAEYSDEPFDQEEAEQAQAFEVSPLDRRARIRWSTNQYKKAIYKDKDGNAIVNSAGDYYDPPVEVDASYWVASIVKNLPVIPSWILTVDHPINTAPFSIQGIPVEAGKARLSNIEISELQREGDYEFYAFAFSIEFKKEGWQVEILDQGLRMKDPNDSTKRIKIQDDDDPPQDVTSPWPLDGSGGKLADPKPDNIVFNTHDHYDVLDFNNLPLA